MGHMLVRNINGNLDVNADFAPLFFNLTKKGEWLYTWQSASGF